MPVVSHLGQVSLLTRYPLQTLSLSDVAVKMVTEVLYLEVSAVH